MFTGLTQYCCHCSLGCHYISPWFFQTTAVLFSVFFLQFFFSASCLIFQFVSVALLPLQIVFLFCFSPSFSASYSGFKQLTFGVKLFGSASRFSTTAEEHGYLCYFFLAWTALSTSVYMCFSSPTFSCSCRSSMLLCSSITFLALSSAVLQMLDSASSSGEIGWTSSRTSSLLISCHTSPTCSTNHSGRNLSHLKYCGFFQLTHNCVNNCGVSCTLKSRYLLTMLNVTQSLVFSPGRS